MRIVRLGGWLFARRTWLPIPIVVALLVTPSPLPSFPLAAAGLATVAAGEWLRLWAVRHIGVISRTRSDRLGPLIATGPFALLRNPLYFGNVLLWIGFTASAGSFWLVPVVGVLLGAAYHAIVRWEEGLLDARIGEEYRRYAAAVPRWNPFSRKSPLDFAGGDPERVEGSRVASRESSHKSSRESPVASRQSAEVFSWRKTFFSERGTLIAIAVGYGLLWLKFAVNS